MTEEHRPINPQADDKPSSAPLAETGNPSITMLEDTTIPVAHRSASQSIADVGLTDSAHNDGRSSIGPADSHTVPRDSISRDVEIGDIDSVRDSLTSARSFGAHPRPHASDHLEIEEVEVEPNAGKAAEIHVTPVVEAPSLTRDSIPQAVEEGIPDDSTVSLTDRLLQKHLNLLISIDKRLSLTDELLTRIDNREAAADVSRQSIQPVPQYSSSAWNPLLKSARERIDAIVDRWRGSLDVLLVFVGLFSAIVTSFFVDSVHNLSPDQAARTNELLANLTEIVIQISGMQAALLNITPSAPFVPDASDVRVNAYWSLALIISISAAALAVAGRAFLAVLTKSTGKPHEMLVDIYQRWEQAERILGPALETLPLILTVPVLLFLVGLLDSIFSATLNSTHSSIPIIVAASLSAAAIVFVGLALFFSLVHACIRPDTSPFRTTISRYIYTMGQRIRQQILHPYKRVLALPPVRWISRHIHSSTKCIQELGKHIRSRVRYRIECIWTGIDLFIHRQKSDLENQISKNEKGVEVDGTVRDGKAKEIGSSYYNQFLPPEARVYHTTLQATHDDDFLDQAAAVFPSMCENDWTRFHFFHDSRSPQKARTLLSNLEIKSLVHLLSPEASYRCNLVASESILRLNRSLPEYDQVIFCSDSQRVELFDALHNAAQREHIRFKAVGDLWRSTFIQSFAVLSHRRRQLDNQPNNQPNFSRIVNMFKSDYVEETSEGASDFIGMTVVHIALSVLYDAALQERRSIESTPGSIVDVFVDYLVNLFGPSSSIAPLTFTKCISLWSGRSVFFDVRINWYDTVSSLTPRIWASRTLTLKDVLTFISWGVCYSFGTTAWVTVSQKLTNIMETQRRPTWPYFGTVPSLKENDRNNSHPLLKRMIPRLGDYIIYQHGTVGIVPYDPEKTAITFAFSAIFEILSWQLDNPLIGDQLVDPVQVNKALLHILGPSPNTFSPVDVAACLACWDGTNIFTRSMLESDLGYESKKSKHRKIFVNAMVCWLWKDVPGGDILDHVNGLTKVMDGIYADEYRYFTDVLMSLLHFEINRTLKLDLALSVLNGLRTKPDAYRSNFLSLTTGLITLIATHTHNTHESLSREQAELLSSLYDRIRTLPGGDDLWRYSWNKNTPEVERTELLELFRTLWKDLYPRGSVGPEKQLMLGPAKSDTSNALRYLGDWSCLKWLEQ